MSMHGHQKVFTCTSKPTNQKKKVKEDYGVDKVMPKYF
jgi:hypothetical protein